MDTIINYWQYLLLIIKINNFVFIILKFYCTVNLMLRCYNINLYVFSMNIACLPYNYFAIIYLPYCHDLMHSGPAFAYS